MSGLPTETLRFMARSLVLSVFALIAVLAILVVGPKLETRFAPVTTQATISGVQQLEGNQTRLSVDARKLRSCDYAGIDWYLGDIDGQAARVSSRFTDPPQIRQTGIHHWTGLIIDLPENLILESSYAIVRHVCHWFWTTETVFFDHNKVPK